jgi:acetate kinase
MENTMKILTLSCWNSSIQYRVFLLKDFSLLALGRVDRVGVGDSCITHILPNRKRFVSQDDYCDHRNALSAILSLLTDKENGVMDSLTEIAAVGHRVAHGGEYFRYSCLIDPKVLSTIRDLTHLAPLHNRYNIDGIEAAREFLPGIPQIAVFDTAFHQTMPEYAYLYPLPYEWYEKHDVRRYGFHGPAHLYLSRRAAALLGKRPLECNLVTVYMDKGVSLCAIRNGVSIDTSMGLTPLEGAIMETRCGDIDPGVITFEMQRGNLSPNEMEIILNQKSGIFGMTKGRHNRKSLIQGACNNDRQCKTTLETLTHRMRKYIGAYIAATGPVDAIAFSRGSGNDDWLIRQMVMKQLDGMGFVLDEEKNRNADLSGGESVVSTDGSSGRIFVIPGNEQLVFAEDVAVILEGGHIDPVNREYTFSRPGFVPRSYCEKSE